MIVFALWVALMRVGLPTRIVFENVVAFPMRVLEEALGDLYCIAVTIMEAQTWLGVVRRKRRYAVLALRATARMRSDLSGLHAHHGQGVPRGDGRVLFTDKCKADVLTPARQHVADR